MNKHTNRKLMEIFSLLFEHFGPQYWWPAEKPFEVMVGAILTQSAAWTNVERAINNLKTTGVLSPQVMRTISEADLAGLIHACGYYNMKTRKLKAMANWLGNQFNDDLETMKNFNTDSLRAQLLEVYGIGEETADSIMLYAFEKPVFVIDAYTRRIIDRLGFKVRGDHYADYQGLFHENLSKDVGLFNEFHALLVCLGKNQCRTVPVCQNCCVYSICKKKYVKRINIE